MSTNQQDVYQIAGGYPAPGSTGPPPGGPGSVVYYPVAVAPRRQSFFMSLFLFFCGFIAVALFSLFAVSLFLSSVMLILQPESFALNEGRLPEKYVSGNKDAKDKVAVLTISGTILGNESGFIKKQIDSISKDKSVKAVVLRVVSPGGTVSGSDYYLEQLKKMKSERGVPVIVSMGSLATSGGYYVAMCGDTLFAEQTTITGSIGVIAPMYDLSELCQKIGVSSDPITSGPMKSMGSMTKPMGEEERKIWQALIDDNFARFKQIVREGRPQFAAKPEELDAIATGQVYTANQALDNGLIDKIGFLDDAIETAVSSAGLNLNNCKVVKYASRSTLLDVILESQLEEMSTQTRILNLLSTPQLYYLMPGALPDVREDF